MKLAIVLSGVAGTLAMTLFTELVSAIFKKPFHVVQILSRMLRRRDNPELLAGKYVSYSIAMIVHYTIGILFSYAFNFFLKQGLLQLTLWNALLFGILAGLIGVLGWRIVLAIHPNPPKIIPSQYLLVIWVGHLIFAIGTFLGYIELLPPPVEADISRCL
jgi:hypothetical protein